MMTTRPLGLLGCLVGTVAGVGLLALTGCPRAAEPDAAPARAHDIATATGTGGDAGEVVAPDEPEPAEPMPESAPETTGAEPAANPPEPPSATAPAKPRSPARRPNRSVRYIDCVRSCTKSNPLAEFSEADARADCEATCEE